MGCRSSVSESSEINDLLVNNISIGNTDSFEILLALMKKKTVYHEIYTIYHILVIHSGFMDEMLSDKYCNILKKYKTNIPDHTRKGEKFNYVIIRKTIPRIVFQFSSLKTEDNYCFKFKNMTPLMLACEIKTQFESKNKGIRGLYNVIRLLTDLEGIKLSTKDVKQELRNPCSVCYEKDVNVLFDECKHIVICDDCVFKITKCPVCNEKIDVWMKVYIS